MAIQFKLQDISNKNVNLFELYFDKGKMLWVAWSANLGVFSIPKGQQLHEVIVPTSEYMRNSFLMNLMC